MKFIFSNTLLVISLTAALCDFMLGGVQCQQSLQDADPRNFEDKQLFELADFYVYPKRAGFVGMRGKKGGSEFYPQSQDLVDLNYGTELNYPRSLRAGFVGMRGKKENYEGNKRAGFVGMRGKKGDWPDFIERDFDHLKMRRGNSGFVGMRG